jgi:VanZ family protein
MKDFLRKHAAWLTLLPVLALMALIFYFSGQPAAESHQTSSGIVARIIRLLFPDYGSLAPALQEEIEHVVAKVVRKGAHFAEYAALGMALLGHLLARRRPLAKPRVWAMLLGALYAATDELHQLFVPGRSGEALDVLLDSAGVAVGILLLRLLLRKRKGRGAPEPPE